jgi:hypothetical protein
VIVAPRGVAVVGGVVVAATAIVVSIITGTGRDRTWCNGIVDLNDWPNAPMQWSVAFVDDDESLLNGVRIDLERRGFRFVEMGRGPCWPCDSRQLNMVTQDRYSASSLQPVEAELCAIAKHHGIEMYWGARPSDSSIRPWVVPKP